MSVVDVSELFEYWNHHPPAHLILAAAHLKERPKHGKGSNGQSSKDEIEGLGMAMGMQAQKMPKEMLEAIQWAEEKKPRRKDV